MRSNRCLPLVSLLLWTGLMLSGCSESTSKCDEDSDCPEFPAYMCDRNAQQCVHLCSRDESCSTGACRNGQCVLPPDPSSAVSCQVTPDFVLGRTGMSVRFDVLVSTAEEGEPLVPASGIQWVAATEAVTGGGEGTHATFTLAAPGEESAAVEARVGNATCRARVTVLPAGVPPGQVRVVVTDERTGRPVPGAGVVAADAQGNSLATGETDEQGVAWLAAQGEVSLSAFHEHYGYLTLAHYDTEQGTRDVWLPLHRNPLELHGGIHGTFIKPPAPDDALIGLAGLSYPAMGFGLEDRQMLGGSVPTPVSLWGEERMVKFPVSAYVSLASTVIKPEYISPGVAGVCDANLADTPIPEDAIRAGVCGTRTAWALTGEVPLSDLMTFTDPEQKDSDSPLSLLYVAAQNPNVLRSFHSSVVRDVQFRLKPVREKSPGNRDFDDTAHFVQQDLELQQLPLGFYFPVVVPMPPPYKSPLDRISILGGADVPGRGFIPLGVGTIEAPDASKKAIAVDMSMAPAHHGLEGSPYRLLVVATNSKFDKQIYIQDAAYSIQIVPLEELPSAPRSVKLVHGFLPVPENGNFNFNPYPFEGLQGREFRFLTSSEFEDTTLVSILFRTNGYRPWLVLMDPQHAVSGIRLPVPPARFQDRTRMEGENGEPPDSRARMTVQAISTHRPDGSALALRTLAEAEEDRLARLSDFITALSVYDGARPGVRWVYPERNENNPPGVTHGSTVTVSIDDYLISKNPADNGHVVLTFKGGIGCEGHPLRMDASPETVHSVLNFQLPADCRGNLMQMTAALVDSQGIPLSPPVSQTMTVNIN